MVEYNEKSIEEKKIYTFKEKIIRGVLAAQHLIAMFGATVLVPFITGLDPSVALFSAGLGTLIFHLCTKGKVPVFLGSSFAFIPVIGAVATEYGDLRYAQGGMFVAGLIYVVVSFLIKKIGMDRIRKLLPAQVVGPMIIVIGINLIPTALNMAGVNDLITGVEGANVRLLLAVVTLGIALTINIFGKGFVKQLAIIIAVVTGYTLSIILGQVNVDAIREASFVAIPNFTLPKFDMGAITIVVPVILAVFMEHIGDITTNGQVVGKNFVEDPGLNRTLLGDGLATLVASSIGGPANTTYGENTGVLALTKNYDPSILRITAVLAIGLSFVDKFGAVIQNIPQAVMGGISILLFSMIALVGVKTIKNEKVKFNVRNIILMGVILFIGLSGLFLSEEIVSKFLTIPIGKNAGLSGLSLAALVGVVLNLVFNFIEKMKK